MNERGRRGRKEAGRRGRKEGGGGYERRRNPLREGVWGRW